MVHGSPHGYAEGVQQLDQSLWMVGEYDRCGWPTLLHKLVPR